MKIAILSFYSGINNRGVERWTYELASRLADKYPISVYQNGKSNLKVKYKIISLGLEYDPDKKESFGSLLRIPFLDYKSRRVAVFTLKVLKRLWKEKFDVIIPTDGGWQPALIRLVTWLRRKKMVIVGHAGVGLGWDDRNNLWSFPNRFVTLSSYGKRWAKSVNPFVKIKHIPDGVDVDRFRKEGRKYDVELKKPVVLCVAALTPTKCIDLAIKAVAEMKGASLLVAGDGPLKKELRRLGKELLGSRFMLRRFSFDKMPFVYRSVDLVTIASIKHYSFEMVLLEAMATNLPVVANRDPIRTEIVGDAGILVDPTDTVAYAKALEKALKTDWEDKPRKQAEKFSWDIVVKKYEKLFKEVVGD